MQLPTQPTQPIFEQTLDLGTIVVPADQCPATQFTIFWGEYGSQFAYYNPEISDKHFSFPSRILRPGDKLRVSMCEQVAGRTSTAEERLEFLDARGAVYPSAQGLIPVWKQFRDELPRGCWVTSFDQKDRLWKRKEETGSFSPMMSELYRHPTGAFEFVLVHFGSHFGNLHRFLCFQEVR